MLALLLLWCGRMRSIEYFSSAFALGEPDDSQLQQYACISSAASNTDTDAISVSFVTLTVFVRADVSGRNQLA